MNWYAIYTKQGKEKAVIQMLSRVSEIETFNPLVRVKKFVRKRLTTVEEELFSSYIFARCDMKKYYRTIKYTRGVRRLLGDSRGFPYIVDEEIIESIKERITDGFVRLDPPDLRKGDKVHITEGPFKGLTGIFLSETKPEERVTILLSTITYQAKVEVDRYLITKNGSP